MKEVQDLEIEIEKLKKGQIDINFEINRIVEKYIN